MRVHIGLGCALVLIGMSLLPTVSIPCPPKRLETSPPQYQETLVPTPAPARVSWSWETSYNRAIGRSEKENKPLLILWTTENCDWCKRLLREFDTELLVWVGKDMVPCRLSVEDHRQLAKYFRVSRFPTMVIVAADRKIIGRREGYARALDVNRWLQEVMKREKQRKRKPFDA